MPSVALVIPVHNDAPTLLACVRAALREPGLDDVNVIVVDDASTDGGPAALRAAFPELTILHLATRGGVARALNAGFAHPLAAGRDVVRLHADVVVETTGWLAQLVEAAAARPAAGVIGARLVYPDGRIQSEGRSFITGLGHHPRHTPRRAFQANNDGGVVLEVDAVPGALAYYSRASLQAVGGLDEHYGLAWIEDDDFCVGARYRGYKIYVHPGVRAVHFTPCHSPTLHSYVEACDNDIACGTSVIKDLSRRFQFDRWEKKWGWHPAYPDLAEIRRLYGHTEIAWQVGEPLRYRPSAPLPSVDVCIVTWNSLSLLRRTLESLALTDYPAELLRLFISDNGSTDGTLAYLDEQVSALPFRLQVVRLPLNTGVAVGMNHALLAGDGELVARLDDDIVLQPDWLRRFVADLRLRPFAGVVGGRTVNDNDLRTLQWAGQHCWPLWFTHQNEADLGQADYYARAVHVAGCCNLYRRDALRRCGLLDIRYSPTQSDDVDHHIALFHAGYEVLYDGHVVIVHKISTGLDRSLPGMASAEANVKKMHGKWGPDVFEIAETALVLSREGRHLPDDLNSSGAYADAPPSSAFPRCIPPLERELALTARLHDELLALGAPGGSLDRAADDYLALALAKRGQGSRNTAVDVLLSALNFRPSRVDLLAALSDLYLDLGQSALARAIASRARPLAPEDPTLVRLASAPALVAPGRPVSLPARPASGGLRVLMVNSYQPRAPGADQARMHSLAEALRASGHVVDIACKPRPDPREHDIVHLWNTAYAYHSLPQLKAARLLAPDVPVVLSPVFTSTGEDALAKNTLQSLRELVSPEAVEPALANLARSAVATEQGRRPVPRRIDARDHGLPLCQSRLLTAVDQLLVDSGDELEILRATFGQLPPGEVLGVGADLPPVAGPEAFVTRFGVRDFALCLAPIDPRHNQLLLLHALRPYKVPVVFVGALHDASYARLCRRWAPPGSHFIPELEPALLSSALAAARLCIQLSWNEVSSPGAFQAALAGRPLVLSDRVLDARRLQPAARLCHPGSVVSVRSAIQAALAADEAETPSRTRFARALAAECAWPAVAERHAAAYRRLIASRKSRVRAA